jgi:hypothetical protein
MTCEAGYGAYTACTEPAETSVIRICLHEHLRRLRVCAGHAERGLSGDPRSTCRECLLMPGELAHRCPVTVVPAEEEGITL